METGRTEAEGEGKVLKERRSPRERGRMGTSVGSAVGPMMMNERRRDETSGRRGGDGRGADAAVGSARAARRRRRGVIDARDAAAKTKTTRDGRTRCEARRRSASSSSSSSSSPQRLRPQIRRTEGKGREGTHHRPLRGDVHAHATVRHGRRTTAFRRGAATPALRARPPPRARTSDV